MLKVAVGESPDFDALAVAGLHAALAIVMVVVVVVMVTVVMITTVTAVAAVVMVSAAVVRSGQRPQIVGRHFAGRAYHSRRIMRMMMIRRVTAVVSI